MTSHMTWLHNLELNNVNQTFWFSTFYVVFGFLTHKKEKIDQKQH